MELKVGIYVRTKHGNIFKIIGGNTDNWKIDISYSKLEQTEEYWLELYKYNDNYSFFNDKNISKASYNIIDLIEVGDYVNGCKVIQQYAPEGIYCLWIKLDDGTHIDKYEDIKSIITKEQIESIKYEVE